MSDIKVRVGQQNAIKVVSSISGSVSDTVVNVVGGIASVTQLNVTGISTFVNGPVLLQNGSLGIGTTNPTSSLWVTGDGYFTGVVTASNFYVGNTLVGSGGSFNNLYVSGISTLGANGGITTTGGDLYVGGDLYLKDDLSFDEFNARNGNITGILSVGQSFYYPLGEPFGIAYFDSQDKLVSTGSTSTAISETNYIVSTDSSGIPTWASIIDGGQY